MRPVRHEIALSNTVHDRSVVNIHSHLWGAVLFLYLLATFYPAYLQHYPTTWVDSAVFVVFLSSAVVCLLASAFFHTSTCHSEAVRLFRNDHDLSLKLNISSRCPPVVMHLITLELSS